MKSFKDFGIKVEIETFIGKKRSVDEIVNIELEVHKFKIEPSKQNSGLCLHLQIKVGNSYHVVFTSSIGLMDTIKRIPAEGFPFTTTIKKHDRRYEFS